MKKKNHIKVRFSTILLCILAILLCAAPSGWAEGKYYNDGDVHDVTEDLDWLHVGADTTVNLYADVSQYIYVYPGSVLNIYSGNVGLYIIVMPGEIDAVVTVYGTDFGGDGDFSTPGEVSFSGGTLTGYYADGSAIDLLFYSSSAIFLQTLETTEEVEIDIKPGSDLNSINLKSRGVVPVAVLSTDDFDASKVLNPATVLFAGASHVRWRLCDVDGDGDDDVLFHFKTQELFENDIDEDSTEATLTGETNNGDVISATDTVRIVPQKKK